MHKSRYSSGAPPRRWRLPPAMLRSVGETLEGLVVLDEFDGELGLKLWQAVRDVRLWAEVDPGSRADLFRGPATALAEPVDARAHAGLLGPLALLRLEMSASARANGEVISAECLRIARYAEAQERLGTAALFAMAASLAAPGRAAPAYEAGRLAAKRRDDVRAETWLRRAVGLARRGEERRAYCRALLALGELYAAREEPTRARSLYTLAVRASRRYAMRESLAEAAFGLLRLAIAAGNHAEVARLQVVARRAFGRDHERAPELVVVLARLWIEGGEPKRAGEALRRLVPDLVNPDERIAALALLARADANPQMAWSIAEAWHSAWSLAEAHPGSPSRTRALVDLALAAMAVGSVDRGRAALERVRELPANADAPLRRDHAQAGTWLENLIQRRGDG